MTNGIPRMAIHPCQKITTRKRAVLSSIRQETYACTYARGNKRFKETKAEE